jgi:hypothetical protein
MAEMAKYPLDDIFGLIRESKYWFSAQSRSLYEVIRVYASTNPKTLVEAEKFILEGILTLSAKNFYRRNIQWEMVVDQYGVIFDSHPWFVKLAIQNEENEAGVSEPLLQEISFHPPEKEFTTTGGIKIPAESVRGSSYEA